MITGRFAIVALVATLAAPVGAFAQAGGMPSTTAPSNSQGTPATSTGVVGTTQVAPTRATSAAKHTTHRRHRTRRHTTSTTSTTSGQ